MEPKSKDYTHETQSRFSVLTGAALIMATSAIGPGFLTQTATFTGKLGATFGFVILISIILDIGAQLNIWRILTVSGKKAQEVANSVFPGAGYLLAFLIVIGGLAFNIGNVAGGGLGVQLITDNLISPEVGAVITGAIAILVFLSKDLGKAMDRFAMLMGFVMILLIVITFFKAQPPVGLAVYHTFYPESIDAVAIITLVGGTVGGYITFAGAHRLIDAGITGKANLGYVTKSSVSAIIIASIMRVGLFLVVLGLVSKGIALTAGNPAATPFTYFLGNLGSLVFGVIIWAAAITSIIGAAFTSVSFFSNFNPWLSKHSRHLIIGFIVFSTGFFALVGRPVKTLILVGTLNGFILPISLGLILLGAYRVKVVGDYRHPIWMTLFGLIVVALMAYLSITTLVTRYF